MRVQIVRLPPVMCARQRRAGKIGGQDAQTAELGVVCLHQPDEAGAKHGFGSGKEGLAQSVLGREVLVDLDFQVV